MRVFLTFALWGVLAFSPLKAAPRYGSSYGGSGPIVLNETKDSVERLNHRIENQETEIRAFEQKIESLDAVLEGLRDQIEEVAISQKEHLQGNSNALEMKIAALESVNKGLVADLKLLQSHANETTAAFQGFKQKFGEWEKKFQSQNQNIENLQGALQTLVDAFQLKTELNLPGEKSYKIKMGDTLEKIAKQHGTTIQALKELNGISSDKIVVGKTLKIP